PFAIFCVTSTSASVILRGIRRDPNPASHTGALQMNLTWIKPALGGLAVGVVGTAIVGFSSLGWVGPGTADKMAAERAEAAVVSVLTPLCVTNARSATAEERAKIVDANYYSRG